MHDFTINELLERRGLNLDGVRLVRHDTRALQAWRKGVEEFDEFVSFQRVDGQSPYNGASKAIQFVPAGSTKSLFVGVHEIIDGPKIDVNRSDYGRYTMRRLPEFEEMIERVIVEWGGGTRSWSQWANKQNKYITSLYDTAQDEVFPGFAHFQTTIDEVLQLPKTWQNVLSSVKGIYLLVCPDTGEQYVGSAYGDEGFFQRWSAYASNGHGGDKLLRQRQRVNYAVSILEIASPEKSISEIIQRESEWKIKLGSRAHGLNAN